MIAKRRELRQTYAELFADVDGVTILGRAGDDADNCWLTAILVDETITRWSPVDLSDALAGNDIESRPLWKPMHLQPVHADWPTVVNGSAEQLFAAGLALPSGSVLTPEEVARVTATIEKFLGERP